MSVIVHRCECGHTDLAHSGNFGTCSFGYCEKRCQKPRAAVGGPSEILDSFADNSVPVEAPTTPGVVFGSSLGGILKTCECASCRATFATAVTA